MKHFQRKRMQAILTLDFLSVLTLTCQTCKTLFFFWPWIQIPRNQRTRMCQIYQCATQSKNTIRDGGSIALYTAYTVDTVDMAYTVDTVDMAYTVDTVYTVYMIYTVDTVQTALHS